MTLPTSRLSPLGLVTTDLEKVRNLETAVCVFRCALRISETKKGSPHFAGEFK